MKRRMMGPLMLWVAVSAAGCGIFETKREVVFVREDLTVNGSPRQILKLVDDTPAVIAYYDGSQWIVVDDVELPAGWLVVSPKLEDE